MAIASVKKIKFLPKAFLAAFALSLPTTYAHSMPPQLQEDLRRAKQFGDFRQILQLGAMAGSMGTFCAMAGEGLVVPGEGPITVDMLNSFSKKLLAKTRNDFDDHVFPYQKVGLNLGIMECNKLLGIKLDYI